MNRRVLIRIACHILFFLILPIFALKFWVQQPSFRKASRSSIHVSPDALAQIVKRISVDFSPRSYQHPESLTLCRQYIGAQFSTNGASVSTQSYRAGRYHYENVIARYGPTEGPRVIVGAHYDAYGDHPGADDNASGVAGLIEISRILGTRRDLQGPVELVAYCTEEPPFFGTDEMGSYQHAKQLAEDGVEVRAMLALEMIGYFTDRSRSQRYPMRVFNLIYPNRGDFIAVIGNTAQRKLITEVKGAMRGTTDLEVYSASVPGLVTGTDFSDHRNFWAHGYNAVMVTDTSFCRNPFYHTVADTWDTLDYHRMAQVVVGVAEAVIALTEDTTAVEPRVRLTGEEHRSLRNPEE